MLIAYDRDDAGEKAAQVLAEKLMAQGLECFRLHFPKGMDANEYALAVKPAAASSKIIAEAIDNDESHRREDLLLSLAAEAAEEESSLAAAQFAS